MDDPQPDDIQARPPERRPEEIQANRPAPRDDGSPLPDYDFKKPSSWGWVVWVLICVVALIGLFFLASELSTVTNKTFSQTAG